VNSSVRSRWAEALGKGAVEPDGALRPDIVDGVVAALALAQRESLAVRITSSPGGDASGEGDAVLLSLGRLISVDLRPAELVVSAQAGASLAELGRTLANAGMAVLGLATIAGPEHVGSAVASGRIPRGSLCGITVAPLTGGIVRVGGVLKDVVGYDLCGLYLGSAGSLGAIVAVDFRLIPAGFVGDGGQLPGLRTLDSLAATLANTPPRSL